MKAVYELRQIKDTKDRDLTKALNLYSNNIEPILRTDTREIMYWIDNYSSRFQDKFILLGLYLNDQLIGFSQLAYFLDECIVFVDYIVIEEGFRRNNTFYQFLEEIKTFLDNEDISYDYIVGEVGYYNDKHIPTEKTRNLIRLLKMSGFGVIKANYFQPMLGKTNFESELMSVLMVYTPNELTKLKKETFQLIINTIYYKHYKRWYDRFFDDVEQAEYILGLNRLRVLINDSIKKKEFIDINGYSHIFSTEPLNKTTSRSNKMFQIIGLAILFFSLSFVIGYGVLKLKRKFDMDAGLFVFISIFSILLIYFLFKIFFKNREQSISEIFERMVKLFT